MKRPSNRMIIGSALIVGFVLRLLSVAFIAFVGLVGDGEQATSTVVLMATEAAETATQDLACPCWQLLVKVICRPARRA